MIGIDSNILIYAHNRASPYYNEAKQIIHTSIEEDLLGISEISLREFYAVITDGRKVDKPFTPANASILLKNYFQSKRVVVCQLTSEVWEKAFEYMVRYKVSRYDLDDLFIALTLWLKGTSTIYTRNIKDFKKFDFIEAVNPFPSAAMRSAPHAPSYIPYGRQSIDEQDV
ncbi:MAG: PIN domain-containing protein, partial [Deltaproteobacteria bacterium]|nr:PIN domain-containing protein [Deltaproteobacteria bacterium]